MEAAAAGTQTVTAGSSGTTTTVDQTSTSGPSGVQNNIPQSNSGMQNNTPIPVPANATADWTSGLNEAQKLYVQNKGFKAPNDVLDSYQNMEKLQGVPRERLLKLPEKSDAPEWGEIYDRMGRPKEAKDYKFAVPEGQKANTEFTDWAQKQFHALGLTKNQGEALASKWNEYSVNSEKQSADSYANQVKTEEGALRREWGAAYDQQLQVGKKAALTFGLGTEEVNKLESALGYSATLKFLASVGSKLGEDSFVTGGNSAFAGALTPDRAQAQIAELKKDTAWTQKYLSGGHEEKAQLERLMKYAYPDLPQD